jgi:hypothetical protein
MKKQSVVLSLLLVACAFCLPAYSQTPIGNTTLSAAVATTSARTIVVASATNITANNTMLFVDGEAMSVNAVNGTTLSVGRGEPSTRTSTHASGALVWFGPFIAFQRANPAGFPAGSCTRTAQLYLPYINIDTGQISDCLGGVWVNGNGNPLQEFQFQAPNTGGTAYTALNTNGTTLVAGTFYCNEIDLDANTWITGLGVLNGTTVGTDNHLVALYDASGNLLANSAAAGVLAASASTYQQIAFTSKYFAVGPARFFGCMQSNGTAATVRMIVTGTQDTYLTKSFAGSFGTIPATFTAPTTFTTAVGPYLYVY